MTEEFIPLCQIAERLHIADSTARFYAKRYKEYFNTIGDGKKKRYSSKTTATILNIIKEGYSQKFEYEQIRNKLDEQFSAYIEVSPNSNNTITAQQQQNEMLINSLEIIANQKQQIDRQQIEIDEVRQQLAELEKKIENIGKKKHFLWW